MFFSSLIEWVVMAEQTAFFFFTSVTLKWVAQLKLHYQIQPVPLEAAGEQVFTGKIKTANGWNTNPVTDQPNVQNCTSAELFLWESIKQLF